MQNLLLEDKMNVEDEFVLFTLRGQVYGIETRYIIEITKLLALQNPEKLPAEVVGILEYGSLFINVVDLKSILDLKTKKYTIDNQILIVTTEESIMGLVVDKVSDIVKIPIDSIQSPPYVSQNSYAKGLCTLDKQNIIILNLPSVEEKVKTSFENQDFSHKKTDLFPVDAGSQEILDTRSTQLQDKFQNEQLSIYDEGVKSITFKINNEMYCLDITKIRNFHRLKAISDITKIPYVPNFIAGLINIKGDFIAVIDLNDYLGQGKTEIKDGTIVIITEDGGHALGILADEIGQRIDVADELERSLPAEGKPEISNFVKDEVVYSFLSVEELFKSKKLHI